VYCKILRNNRHTASGMRSIFDKVNTQIGNTTFNGKRRMELLCGPSINKLTACTGAEKHRQPSNVSDLLSTEHTCHQIHSEPSGPSDRTHERS